MMRDEQMLQASGGAALLNSRALEELRHSVELQELMEAMRAKEIRFIQQLSCVDDATLRLSCQQYIAGLLEGCELDEAHIAKEPPALRSSTTTSKDAS